MNKTFLSLGLGMVLVGITTTSFARTQLVPPVLLVQATDDDVPEGEAMGDDDDVEESAPRRVVRPKPKAQNTPRKSQKTIAKKAAARKAPAVKTVAAKPLPRGKAIPTGLYFRIQQWFFNGSLSISQEHFAFWDNGRVYRGIPKGGLESFNWAAAARKEPGQCGTYTIAGNNITFKMLDGKTSSMKFARKGKDLELDGLFTSQQTKYAPNSRLNGTFEGGASVSGGGSYIANVQSLKFTSSGQFQSSAIGAVSADTTAGTVSEKSESNSSGTYRLSGNTLVLRHKDGRVTSHTVYPYDMGKGKKAINVDGTMMHLR